MTVETFWRKVNEDVYDWYRVHHVVPRTCVNGSSKLRWWNAELGSDIPDNEVNLTGYFWLYYK